jgi:hypothetical protein
MKKPNKVLPLGTAHISFKQLLEIEDDLYHYFHPLPRDMYTTHWCDCLGDDFEAPLWNVKGQNAKNKSVSNPKR